VPTITLEDILTNKAKDKMKASTDLSKIARLFEAGSIISDANGSMFRVRAKTAGPGGVVFKLADMQGKPVPTPTDFHPINHYAAKLAKWMRFVVAYNADWDQYVKEYIRAAGLPVDESYNWAKWFQAKFLPKLKGDDEVKDEAIHHTIVTALAHRKALDPNNPSGFQNVIKRFPAGVQSLPLEKQVTQFLLTLFSGRVQEANQFIDKVQRPDSDSISEPTKDDPNENGRNAIDVQNYATPSGEQATNFRMDMAKFSKAFAGWLRKNEHGEAAVNYLHLLNAVIYFVLHAKQEPKISDISPLWSRLTQNEKHPKGLGFDSLKTYWGKFAQLVKKFVEDSAGELEDNPLVAIVERMPDVNKAMPAKASSLLKGLKVADVEQCSANEFCPQCHADAEHCKCPNKESLLDGKTTGDHEAAGFGENSDGQIIQAYCPLCGSSPVYQEDPAAGAPTPYYCHFCNRGFDQPKPLIPGHSYDPERLNKKGEVDAGGAKYVGDNDPEKMGGKTADDVSGDFSEAKAEVVSPDTVDNDIKQSTEPIEKQGSESLGIGDLVELMGQTYEIGFIKQDNAKLQNPNTHERISQGYASNWIPLKNLHFIKKYNPEADRTKQGRLDTPAVTSDPARAPGVEGDFAQAKSNTVSVDTIDKDIHQRTVSPAEAAKVASQGGHPQSCWGCGPDWSHRWQEEDLAAVKIEGETYRICPDCIEDVGPENLEFDNTPDEGSDVSVSIDSLRPRESAMEKEAGPFDLQNSPSDYSKGAPSNEGPDENPNECPECEHELPHDPRYGCEHEFGDMPGGEGDFGPYGAQARGPCGCMYGIKTGSMRLAALKTAVLPHEFTNGIRSQTNVQDTGRLEGDTGPQSPSERDPNWRVTGAEWDPDTKSYSHPDNCSECGGSGVKSAPPAAADTTFQGAGPCPVCQGSGKIDKKGAAAPPSNPGVGGAAGLTPNQNPNANIPNQKQAPPVPSDLEERMDVLEQSKEKHTVPPDLPFSKLHLQSLKTKVQAASMIVAGANRDIIKKLEDAMIFDRVGWSGKFQEYICKETYFYTHGRNEDKLAEAVKRLIPEAVITSARNYWHSWPKESYWEVRFKVPPNSENTTPATTETNEQETVMAEPKTQGAVASQKRASVLEKIKARRTAKDNAKWAQLRRVADENSPQAAEALDQLAQAFGELADRVDAFRENLDLVDAPVTASLKTRIAAKRALGTRLKKYAEESPQILADAVNELFKSLDEVAAGVEAFADNMGIELNMTPVEEAFVDEGQAEIEHGEEMGEEMAGGEESEGALSQIHGDFGHSVEANSGSGAKGWTNDRDESGQPKSPTKVDQMPTTSQGQTPPK
jgi:hypothetical protein